MSLTSKQRAALRSAANTMDPVYQIGKGEIDDTLKQGIADSWPNMMDDSCARNEWDWKPAYDLDAMTRDMLEKLAIKLGKGE